MLTVVVVGSGAPVVTASSVKLNMLSSSVLFFSVFVPLMIALPVAPYVLTSAAVPSPLPGIVPVRSVAGVVCVQPSGIASVTVYSVPAGSPMIFTVSPSLMVIVASPFASKVTVSDVVPALVVRSALKMPATATLFFVALIITVNAFTSPVLSPTSTVLVISRSPALNEFSTLMV